MNRFKRVSLGIGSIFLGLLGFIFPTLQALLLLALGTLILWSDVQNLLRLIDSIEKQFPGSSGPVQRFRQSFVRSEIN